MITLICKKGFKAKDFRNNFTPLRMSVNHNSIMVKEFPSDLHDFKLYTSYIYDDYYLFPYYLPNIFSKEDSNEFKVKYRTIAKILEEEDYPRKQWYKIYDECIADINNIITAKSPEKYGEIKGGAFTSNYYQEINFKVPFDCYCYTFYSPKNVHLKDRKDVYLYFDCIDKNVITSNLPYTDEQKEFLNNQYNYITPLATLYLESRNMNYKGHTINKVSCYNLFVSFGGSQNKNLSKMTINNLEVRSSLQLTENNSIPKTLIIKELDIRNAKELYISALYQNKIIIEKIIGDKKTIEINKTFKENIIIK